MGTTTHRFLLSIGAGVGVMALASAGLPASAVDPIACGDIITSSTTLTQDLVCEGGDGLIIGAPGVVLDLAGFTISGGGRAVDEGDPRSPAGVRIDGDLDATILNGRIERFEAGVEVQQAHRAHVTLLHISDVIRGVNIGNGGSHLIDKNVIHNAAGDGVRVGGSADGTIVTKNTVSGAVWGISVADNASDTIVDKNIAADNQNMGVGAFGAPTGTRFLKNVVSNTRDNGIIIGSGVADSYLEKNEVYASGLAGIKVEDASTTLVKKIVVNNGGRGIEAVAGVTGSGNLAAGNNGGVDPQCTFVVCLPYV